MVGSLLCNHYQREEPVGLFSCRSCYHFVPKKSLCLTFTTHLSSFAKCVLVEDVATKRVFRLRLCDCGWALRLYRRIELY